MAATDVVEVAATVCEECGVPYDPECPCNDYADGTTDIDYLPCANCSFPVHLDDWACQYCGFTS